MRFFTVWAAVMLAFGVTVKISYDTPHPDPRKEPVQRIQPTPPPRDIDPPRRSGGDEYFPGSPAPGSAALYGI